MTDGIRIVLGVGVVAVVVILEWWVVRTIRRIERGPDDSR